MEPERSKTPLVSQPWLIDLLAAKGFVRSSPNTFVNGKVTIRIRGTRFLADPGTGEQPWLKDFKGVRPDIISIYLQQILSMPQFRLNVKG